MAHYRLNLLGGFELWSGPGDAVRLPTRKAEALLAYLALAPHGGHARDALTGLLWGDSSDQSARASLRQTLFLIGKAFDRTVLEAEARFVGLAPDALDVDVVEFERHGANSDLDALERAARLYRGDLLAGSAVNEPAFEEWLTTERERLRERAIDVFSRLVTAHGARGSTDRAIQAALSLVALDSLEESAHRALMRLYANAGRRAAALRQYQSCVAVLQRELATEPAAETQALYRDILQRAAQSEPAPTPAGVSEAIAQADTRDAPIGREHDLLVLRGALDDASQKRGRVLVVLGDAGIGKTTLFGAFAAEAAARGSRVLLGRSYESEQILPFAPWVDALRSGDLGDVFEGLEPAWRAELTRLLPDAHAPDQPGPSGDQRRLFESIARLLERLAAVQPLVIVLEDLHWADEMSTRLLSFLGRRLRDKRVVLAASARAEELDDASALRRALEELRAEPHFAALTLPSLSAGDTAVLVRALARTGAAPDPHLEAEIWRMSEGNPFVAVETLRALAEGHVASAPTGAPALPERVRAIIGQRLERLTSGGRALVAAAAVIGREFEFALIARAAGMTERDAADAVEELVRRRVLHAVGEGFDFMHDYIRQAAYGRLLEPRRRLLHAQVGAALEHVYAEGLEPHYAALGFHYEQGDIRDKAFVYLREAGHQAAARSAYREAARALERALAVLQHLPERLDVDAIELRLMLRNVLLPLGEESRIVECLREAEAIAERAGDSGRLARIRSYLCRHFHRVNDYPRAIDAGQRALAAEAVDVEVQVAANLYLGMVYQTVGDFSAALDHLHRTIALVDAQRRERFGLPYLPAVFSRTWLAWCLADLGDFDAGLARARQAVELAESADQPWDCLVAYRGMGLVQMARGDASDAVRFLDRAMRLCESVDVAGMRSNITGHLGYARVLAGEVAEGVRLLEQAVNATGAMQSIYQARLLAFLAEALILLGRHAEALERANLGLQLARERGERANEVWALRAVSLALSHTRRSEARTRYEEALALATRLGMKIGAAAS